MFSRFELLQGAVSYLLLSGAQHRADSLSLSLSLSAARFCTGRSIAAVDGSTELCRGDNSTMNLRRIVAPAWRTRSQRIRLDVNIVTRLGNAAAWQISNLNDYLCLLMTGGIAALRISGPVAARESAGRVIFIDRACRAFILDR